MLSSLLVMLSGAASHAFLLPPGPVSPTADPGTDVLFGRRNNTQRRCRPTLMKQPKK